VAEIAQGYLCPLDIDMCEGRVWADWTGEHAIQSNDLDMLKLAISRGCAYDENLCAAAAHCGNLDILIWLRCPPADCYQEQNTCPWDKHTCEYAAMQGHLDIIKWARSQNPPCPWGSLVCQQAAGEGHLEALQWLRDPETGGGACDWDASECAYDAAGGGHLETFKWICAWDGFMQESDLCSAAAMRGHLDIIKWVRRRALPGNGWWSSLPCSDAAEHGHLDVLKWLRDPETGGGSCPWQRDECVRYALDNNHADILEWIHAN